MAGAMQRSSSHPVAAGAADLDSRLGTLIGEAEVRRRRLRDCEGCQACKLAEADEADLIDRFGATRDGYRQCATARFTWDEAVAAAAEMLRAEQTAAKQQAPRRGGHRAALQGPLMRVLEGGKAAFIAAPAAVIGVAHRAARVKLAAAATVAAATAVTGAVLIAPSHTLQDTHGYGAGPVTSGAVIVSATPYRPSLVAAVTHPVRHHKQGTSASSALPVASSPAAVPGAVPSSPSSQPAQPAVQVSVVVAGTLLVSPQSINLVTALTGTATVRIRAWGGDASWSVPAVPSDLTLTLPDGTQVNPGQSYDLSQGDSVTLTVGLSLNLDGSQLVTFTVGSTTVSVTVPLPVPVSVPSVVPTPSVLPSL